MLEKHKFVLEEMEALEQKIGKVRNWVDSMKESIDFDHPSYELTEKRIEILRKVDVLYNMIHANLMRWNDL